jgi:hypothetical protein
MSLSNCLKWVFSLSCLFLVLLFASCSKDDDKDPVVTDENLYINEIYASGDDWIELFNNTDASKDVSGYKIYDDEANKYNLPSGTVVPAKGFLVIFCDDLNTGLHTNFKLSSAGETVYLENQSNLLVDKVLYPALMNGQSYGRYPDGSTNFAVSGNTTEGASNGDSNAPAIVSVTRTPLVVGMGDAVTVTSEFLSVSGIATVKLFYRANNSGSFTTVDMTSSAGKYVGTIPSLGSEGRIDYYVEAKNNSGNTTLSPYNAPDKTYNYLMTDDPLPQLVINEFMVNNISCCPDTDSGADEFDDWIEIHNTSDQPVNIGGMYLSDDKTNPFNSKIPDSNPTLTTIPAGGYLLIWADGSKDQGELHVDFGLSADGEDVGLYYYDGRAIDEHSYGAQTTENSSLSRSPNATGDFSVDLTPTPKAVN